MDVLPAHEITRHEPKADDGGFREPGDFASFSSSRPSLQLALGYGRRSGKHTGIQLQLSAGSLSLPTLDAYFQFLGDPLDAGVGLAFAVPGFVSPYVMAGKAFGNGSVQLRIDGGLRGLWVFESYGPDYPAAGPMALISLQRGRWGAGLWSDAVFFNKPQYYIYCDETCMAEDLARWRVSVGLYVQIRLRDLF